MVVFYVSITSAGFLLQKSHLASLYLETINVKILLFGLRGKWKFGSYLSDTLCYVIPYYYYQGGRKNIP